MAAFSVGDKVAIISRYHQPEIHTVASVRAYKYRTKVTLDDGTEWNGDGTGWKPGESLLSRCHIVLWTAELADKHEHEKRARECVERVRTRFDFVSVRKLTREQLDTLMALLDSLDVGG